MGLMGPNSFEGKNWNRGTRLVYSSFFFNNLKVQQKNTFDFAFPRLRTFSKSKCLRCEFLADVWVSFGEVLLEGGVLSTLVELFFL